MGGTQLQSKYIPFQPGFEHRLHYRNAILPAGHPLYGVVSDFYQFDSGALQDEIYVLPDGCMDLLFCYDGTGMTKTVEGYHRKMMVVPIHQVGCAFGVRFIPGGLADFIEVQATELVGNQKPIEELFGRDDLLDKMEEATTFEQRVALMTDFLLKRLPASHTAASITKYCTKRILASQGKLRIAELSQETGYTVRYLRELYDRYVGISPKELCEIVQFQSSFTGLTRLHRETREFSLGDLAAQAGYYDQSHMNKCYYKMVGSLPSRFYDEINSRI